MKVIIVDDEINVRNSITKLLQNNYPDIMVVASAGSVREGYEAITAQRPDLLFLDVELPDGNGFDLLDKLSPVNFKTVFITGHHEYALRAIKVSALDYLLKPFDDNDLQNAIEKSRRAINHAEEQLKVQALAENLQNKKALKRIILHTADNLQLVSVCDIVRAEADSNYTRFWLSDGKRIIVSRTIKEYDGLLSGSGMIRVHQSHLVNINYIDRFVKKDGGYLLLKEGTKIPVSPLLRKQVLKALTEHLYD